MNDHEKIDAIHAYLAHESLRLGNKLVQAHELADSGCSPVEHALLALVYAENDFFRHISHDIDKILQ